MLVPGDNQGIFLYLILLLSATVPGQLSLHEHEERRWQRLCAGDQLEVRDPVHQPGGAGHQHIIPCAESMSIYHNYVVVVMVVMLDIFITSGDWYPSSSIYLEIASTELCELVQ